MIFYHGGIGGLSVGARLVPSPPHVDDGCPVCEARKAGRVLTAGEYLRWARAQGPRGDRLVRMLEEVDPATPIDPPSAKSAVYITTALDYATWYAARSRGDLYQVVPVGAMEKTAEDHFPSWTVAEAKIVRVLRRDVALTRTERRRIDRSWKKADRRALRRDPRQIQERAYEA